MSKIQSEIGVCSQSCTSLIKPDKLMITLFCCITNLCNYYSEEDELSHIDQVFGALVKCINSHKMSACGRDSVLELIIRNITSKDGLNWTRKFLETDGMSQASNFQKKSFVYGKYLNVSIKM